MCGFKEQTRNRTTLINFVCLCECEMLRLALTCCTVLLLDASSYVFEVRSCAVFALSLN